jgi:phosphoribosylaminoimidazole-succinocarboxamide synthase
MYTDLPGLIHRGKVRDTYELDKSTMLMVATDRISAFDVVLPTGIPRKGRVLSSLSAFWFQRTGFICPNHYLSMADDPEARTKYSFVAELSPELAQQAMVVRRAQRIDIECIVRGHLAGSAWAEYRKGGTVFGRLMPPGLKEGTRLEKPLFTPTTKAEEGHDENMPLAQVVEMVGPEMAQQLETQSIAIYNHCHQYASSRGILLADTKLEFGLINGRLTVIDEMLTPDSSRFWDAEGYEPGHSQPNFDKQFVRDWLNEQGWDHEPPAPALPDDIVDRTHRRYLEAFRQLTGGELA